MKKPIVRESLLGCTCMQPILGLSKSNVGGDVLQDQATLIASHGGVGRFPRFKLSRISSLKDRHSNILIYTTYIYI